MSSRLFPKDASDGLYLYFRENGAPAGSKVMNVDGDPTPVLFQAVAPVGGAPWNVERVMFSITDTTITDWSQFGGIAALSNGITMKAFDPQGQEVFDFLQTETIKSNYGFMALAGVDVEVKDLAALDAVAVRWTISKGLGGPIRLHAGMYLEIKVQDDLLALSSFETMAQGWLGG